MKTFISLYSTEKKEIENFLKKFFENDITLNNKLEWSKEYNNPIEMVDLIGSFIDNNDKYKINMWVSLDEGLYINVTENNANNLIKYMFERFVY